MYDKQYGWACTCRTLLQGTASGDSKSGGTRRSVSHQEVLGVGQRAINTSRIVAAAVSLCGITPSSVSVSSTAVARWSVTASGRTTALKSSRVVRWLVQLRCRARRGWAAAPTVHGARRVRSDRIAARKQPVHCDWSDRAACASVQHGSELFVRAGRVGRRSPRR